MTVQELIDRLNAVNNKDVPVVLVEWSVGNPLCAKSDLSSNRIVVQPHRVAIILD